MKNLLILYNPYYQKDVIVPHLQILQEYGMVAFGKVRSKLKNMPNPAQNELDSIYANTSKQNPLQLFLCDYANLFVCKVVHICDEIEEQSLIPSYYKQNGLCVEKYFVINDIYELVREDFSHVRDCFLANFRTPTYDNHTYAIYGNSYVYPLIIEQKKPAYYFENERNFLNIFKSEKYLKMQEIIRHYVLGERIFSSLHADSIEAIISAELEYDANKYNPLYDFTGMLVKLSKCVEREVYERAYETLDRICKGNGELLGLKYNNAGLEFCISDFFTQRPSIATTLYILTKHKISEYLEENELRFWKRLKYEISTLQELRNRGVHESITTLEMATTYRQKVLGIGEISVLLRLFGKL